MNTELSGYVQDGIIKLMLEDEDFLKICYNTVNPSIFPSSIINTIVKCVYDFYKLYQTSPKNDFKDFFLKFGRFDEDDLELYDKYLKRIKEVEANKKYIITSISDYIQLQTFNKLILKGADTLKKGNINEFKSMFLNAFKNKVDGDELGINFWDVKHSDFKTVEEERVCPTGIPMLDDILGGYHRSELFLWLAPTNTGKSWALVDGTKTSLIHGLNVAYITLEMTSKNITKRLAMAITGSRRDNIKDDKEFKIKFFDGEVIDFSKRPTLEKSKKVFEENKETLRKRGGCLFTKGFIEGKCSVSTIEMYLDQLEVRTGKIPDILFLDYADLMVADEKKNDDLSEINNVYTGLRGLAKTRNICIVTASQATRDAHGAKKVGLKHTAKNIDKVRIADVVISLNQTEEELRNNAMRLFIAKLREGKKGQTIEIKQSFEIGGFCLDARLQTENFDD